MKNEQQPMQSVWHSLLWKEWHEHKWKLAALMGLVATASLVTVLSSQSTLSFEDAMDIICVSYCVLAGAFLGMSTAGRESGQGTLPFMQSLPSPMWRPGIAKLGMALFTAVLPLVVLGFLSYLYLWRADNYGLRLLVIRTSGTSDEFAITILGAMLGVSSLLLWMTAAGFNRSDEVRAGAIGFLVICIAWIIFIFFAYQIAKRELWQVGELLFPVIAAWPGALWVLVASSNEYPQTNFYILGVVAVVGHGCVLAWYFRRLGRVVMSPGRTEANTNAVVLGETQQLGPPMRSQLTSIVWKQVQESGPLVMIAVGFILVFVSVIWLFRPDSKFATPIGEILSVVTLSVCFLVTIVVGFGVFFEDLKPRVDDFWRAQPINFPLWFGAKFFTGMLLLTATFGSLWLIGYWLTGWEMLGHGRELPYAVIFAVATLLLIYTVSMATYCICRQPIYAAVSAIVLLISGWLIFVWIRTELTDGFVAQWMGPIMFASLFFFQICATVLAWQALRRNWSLKG